MDTVEFFDGNELVDIDRSRPFRERLSRKELGGAGPVLLRVRASLIDGRRTGWEKKLKVCR